MTKAKSEDAAIEGRKVPKGGRVGGTIFPRLTLQDALEFAEKLARKTSGGPLPIDTALVGVFNTKGPEGKVRASALKQYGLLGGTAADGGYIATTLAREIDAAPPEDRPPLWRRAFLSAKIFSQILDTLQGDTVTKARIRQVAMTHGVHGATADACVDLFVAGALKAGLGSTATDDRYILSSAPIAAPQPDGESTNSEGEEQQEQTSPPGTPAFAQPKPPAPLTPPRQDGGGPKTGATLQLHVDSSSDPDKLRKQLELLREFGMI